MDILVSCFLVTLKAQARQWRHAASAKRRWHFNVDLRYDARSQGRIDVRSLKLYEVNITCLCRNLYELNTVYFHAQANAVSTLNPDLLQLSILNAQSRRASISVALLPSGKHDHATPNELETEQYNRHLLRYRRYQEQQRNRIGRCYHWSSAPIRNDHPNDDSGNNDQDDQNCQ